MEKLRPDDDPKPCPWCGEEPLTETQNGFLIIECVTPKCIAPIVSSREHGDLILQWNTRRAPVAKEAP